MTTTEIAYFGPEGSFASLVAKRQYSNKRLIPIPSVPEVVEYVKRKKNRLGIVPIENSSGGIILDTVDCLVDKSFNLYIQEELGIQVKLAFLGHRNKMVKVIYSHFAPLLHCEKWIRLHYPKAETRRVGSTSEAAKIAAKDKNAAAIGTAKSAKIYGLDIITPHIEKDIPNVTQFFTLGHKQQRFDPKKNYLQTSLVVFLKDQVGSLCRYLEPYAEEGVNLNRIVSRNVIGQPNTYVFLIGVDAALEEKAMHEAINNSRRYANSVRPLGSYPRLKTFEAE